MSCLRWKETNSLYPHFNQMEFDASVKNETIYPSLRECDRSAKTKRNEEKNNINMEAYVYLD